MSLTLNLLVQSVLDSYLLGSLVELALVFVLSFSLSDGVIVQSLLLLSDSLYHVRPIEHGNVLVDTLLFLSPEQLSPPGFE